MKQKTALGYVATLVIGILIGFFLIPQYVEAGETGFEILCKDKDGNIWVCATGSINKFGAIVGASENVQEIQMTYAATNVGERVLDMTPSFGGDFGYAFGAPAKKTIPVGGTATWTSNWVDVEAALGTSAEKTFSITATGECISGAYTLTCGDASANIVVKEDPVIGVDATILVGAT